MKHQNLSQSIESVAESEHSHVTLTRFNAFPTEPPQDGHKNATNSTLGHSPSRPVSAGGLFSPNATHHTIDLSSGSQHLGDTQRAQFQIVWRHLTFEVDTRSYDKIIANAFNKLSSIFVAGSSRHHNGLAGKKSSFAMTTNSQDALKQYQLQRPAETARRVIFQDLNGYIKSGEVTAILGPSGAGKTSLLNALCGQTENYRGSIQLLGGAQAQRMRSTIIPQRDYLIEKLTVRECLNYASRIMNPDKWFDHEANIARIVEMLNLFTCFESSISIISGGEYKRVSIAQELLSQPDILVLDEPTSGLDSLNCRNLVDSLASLIQASREGHINPIAVVMTIHQPDFDVFNTFDHVYCMARNGMVIYDGHPRDSIRVIRSHAQFEDSNSPRQFRTTTENGGGDDDSAQHSMLMTNPANLLIEIASGRYGPKPIESLARLHSKQSEVRLAELLSGGPSGATLEPNCYVNSAHSSANDLQDNSVGSSPPDCPPAKPERAAKLTRDKRLSRTSKGKRNLFFYHTNLLARRAFLATIRDPMISLISLAFFTVMPFVMYVVFPRNVGSVHACPVIVREMESLALASNQTLAIAADLQEQLTVSYECAAMLFIVISAFTMCSIGVAALTFPLNMHVLLKEVRNSWYQLNAFGTAETIASFPFQVFLPVASTVVVYLLLEMPSSFLQWRMWALALVVVIASIIGQAIGLIFGALFMDSVHTAIFTSVASTLPLMLVSGFVVRIKEMPAWLGVMSYASPYRYILHLTSMVRFGFGLCPCDQSTEDYIRNQPPRFTDIPAQVRSVFGYYLGNLAAGDETATANSSVAANQAEEEQIIPGVFYGMRLNSSERTNIIHKLSSKETDLFAQFAEQMTRSFSFGQSIESCKSARSQILNTFDTPQDNELPFMFGCVICLLIGIRVCLFLAIKYKIYSQI